MASRLGFGDHVLDVTPRLLMIINIEMPAIQIRIDNVVVIAGRVVLDQPGRVQRADGLNHVAHPLLRVAVLFVFLRAP